MNQCQTCSFVAKNKAGLSAHTRGHAKRQEEADPAPILPEVPAMGATDDCPHCSLLPAGSVNVVSMFIVVVFCLTAVMFIAMYKMDQQQAAIQSLQAQVASYEAK